MKLTPFLLIFVLAGFVAGQSSDFWNEFAVGTWGDPRLSMKDPRADSLAIDSAKKAGINFFAGIPLVNADTASFRYALERVATVGNIYTFVRDSRLDFNRYDDTVARSIAGYYKALPSHLRKVMLGYFVGDEPSDYHLGAVNRWMDTLTKLDPEKLTYLGLLPIQSYPSARYEAYVDRYLQNKSPLAGYDNYPFPAKGFGDLRPKYFKNLELFSEKVAAKPDKRFWATIYGIEHYFVNKNCSTTFAYAPITSPLLKFLAHAPMVYGAKGLMYFSYEQWKGLEKCNPEVRNEVYLPGARENPKIYGWLKEQNRAIQNLGRTLVNLRWISVAHGSEKTLYSGEKVPGVPALSPVLKQIGYEQAAVGLFKDEAGKSCVRYLLVMNKDTGATHKVPLILKGRWSVEVHSRTTAGWKAFEKAVHSADSSQTSFSITLPASEIELIRITPSICPPPSFALTDSLPKAAPVQPLQIPMGLLRNAFAQGGVDRAIDSARKQGLDYWIFDMGGKAFEAYRSSSRKPYVRFSLIIAPAMLAPGKGRDSAITHIVNLLQDPECKKMPESRPLLFIMDTTAGMPKGFASSNDIRDAFDLLRGKAQDAGLKNPYLVFLGSTPEKRKIPEWGFDTLLSRSTVLKSAPTLLKAQAARTFKPGELKASVGAYYFDGWAGKNEKADQAPWAVNAPTHLTQGLAEDFKMRKPLWGWRDDSLSIMEKQIDLAADHGITFFAFCWYMNHANTTVADDPLHTSLALFLKAKNRNRMRFCLLVANHAGSVISGRKDWETATGHFLPYLQHERAMKTGGKPMIIIYDPATADSFDLAILQTTAKKAGLPGLAIAGCSEPALNKGFEYSTKYACAPGYEEPFAECPYEELASAARKTWWCPEGQRHIPVIMSGWDPRPWRGKKGLNWSGTLESWYFTGGTPDKFGAQVRRVSLWMDRHPEAITPERIFMIYAWNELGEGGYLVPTAGDPQGQYLKALKDALNPED